MRNIGQGLSLRGVVYPRHSICTRDKSASPDGPLSLGGSPQFKLDPLEETNSQIRPIHICNLRLLSRPTLTQPIPIIRRLKEPGSGEIETVDRLAEKEVSIDPLVAKSFNSPAMDCARIQLESWQSNGQVNSLRYSRSATAANYDGKTLTVSEFADGHIQVWAAPPARPTSKDGGLVLSLLLIQC